MKRILFILVFFVVQIVVSQIKKPIIGISSINSKQEIIDGVNKYSRINDNHTLDGKYQIMIAKKVSDYTDANYLLGESTGFMESGSLNKGYKNGQWKTLYKRKTVVKTESWNDGIIAGKYNVYDINKKILYETNFGSDGNGKYKDYYYATGVLKQEGDYENGKKQGEWCDYDTKGNVKKITKYISGIAEE